MLMHYDGTFSSAIIHVFLFITSCCSGMVLIWTYFGHCYNFPLKSIRFSLQEHWTCLYVLCREGWEYIFVTMTQHPQVSSSSMFSICHITLVWWNF